MPLNLDDKCCSSLYPKIHNQIFANIINGCLSIVQNGYTQTKICLNDFNIPIEFHDKQTFILDYDEEKNICYSNITNDINSECLFFDNIPTGPFKLNIDNEKGYIIKTETISQFKSGDFDLSFSSSFGISYIQVDNPNYFIEVGDIITTRNNLGIVEQTLTVGYVEYFDTYIRIYFNEYLNQNNFFITFRIPILKMYSNFLYVKSKGSIFTNGDLITIEDTIYNDGNFILSTSKPVYNGITGIAIKASFIESTKTLTDFYLYKSNENLDWSFGSSLIFLTGNNNNFLNGLTLKNPTDKKIKFEILLFV